MNDTAQAVSLWGWIALHFVVGLAGTWLARRYALHRQLIDQPGERRSHDTPTPRGGGIAIVAALLLALAWLAFTDAPRAKLHVAGAVGLLLVAGVGWIDDHRPLSPWWRLAVHALAASVLAWGIVGSGGGAWQAASGFGLALVLVNIWNFMDGIDGLAASQALLVALGYAWLASGSVAWLALALAAACLGFLPYNLPRARIFLGDVGSGALGFALALLAAWLAGMDAARLPVLLLPLSAFMVDAGLTLAVRMLRGERWWLPHTGHAYQRWSRRCGRHGVPTGAYACWTAVTVIFMIWLSFRPQAVIIAALGIAYLAAACLWWLLQRTATMGNSGGRA